MAFLVEDGTGLANANSGASIAEADAYFTDRLVTAWVGDDTTKQGALIRATDYIELRFASRFKGTAEFDGVQALSFPRLNDEGASVGLPIAYKRAICEYAVRALSAPLAPDISVSSTGVGIIAESHKTGPITDTYRYASKGATASVNLFRPYPAADALLGPLLKQRSGLIR